MTAWRHQAASSSGLGVTADLSELHPPTEGADVVPQTLNLPTGSTQELDNHSLETRRARSGLARAAAPAVEWSGVAAKRPERSAAAPGRSTRAGEGEEGRGGRPGRRRGRSARGRRRAADDELGLEEQLVVRDRLALDLRHEQVDR